MTIKTINDRAAATSTSSTNGGDTNSTYSLKIGGARRNLFGAVDRNNLNEQIQNSNKANERALSNYKYEAVISVIKRDDESQARRLKYLPAASTATSSKDYSGKTRSCSTHHTMQSMLKEHSASSSLTLYKSTESAKLLSTHNKAINDTLPRGQKTIKEYFPTVKRSRQNQRGGGRDDACT